MIKFEEHEGKLFLMLDKPTPLTPETEMPCLVRLIQDDSPMGKHEEKVYFCDAIKKNQLYGNRLYAYETRRVGCIAEPRELEIIGYPVADGSKDWALYQMMQGEMVCHKTSRWDWYRMYNDHAIQNRTAGCLPRVSAWLESTVQSGWQIYKEPKPLLAKAKVGDLCQRRDGKWVQIDRLLSIGGMPWICYEIGGLRYINNGEQLNFKLSELGIISTEPLAPEGTAEWAWQMLKLQKPVSHPAEGKLQDTDYTKEGFVRCMAKTGWQLYEPKPEPDKEDMHLRSGKDNPERQDFCHMYEPQPEPQYKVGDYLEVDENGKIVHCYIVPKSEANQEISGLLYDLSTPKRWVGCIYRNKPNTHIIRKLKPSEVIIKIGCLSGTVRRINDLYFSLNQSKEVGWVVPEATIPLAMLDTTTAELVRELLKAQEEE